MWQPFGLTFHAYGFVVGLAVVLAWWNLEKLCEKFQQKKLDWLEWLVVLLFTLLGARLWHVLTEWSAYNNALMLGEWRQLFAVWHGGISIVGALVGMVLGVWWVRSKSFLVWLDFLALLLPWSQALGRVANWINQELYGWPTQLPWSIPIAPEHRVAAVQDFSSATKFHPLFAYEAIPLLGMGIWLHFMSQRETWQPGSLKLWWSYLAGYSVLRFLLDFLRIDHGPSWLGLGLNQWLMLGSLISSSGWWIVQRRKDRNL